MRDRARLIDILPHREGDDETGDDDDNRADRQQRLSSALRIMARPFPYEH